MAGIAKPSIDGLKSETTIKINSSLVRAHKDVLDVSNNINALFDGDMSTSYTYGAVFLRGDTGTNFIDFTTDRKIRIWAIATKTYSDSGGSTGQSVRIQKWNGSNWAEPKTVATKNDGTWYDLTGELEVGRYKIVPLANYVIFDEWYVESLIQNKTLILSKNEYKKFNNRIISENKTQSPTNMTSNVTPAPYVASASSSYSTTYPVYNLFTPNTALYWASLSGKNTNEWIQIDLGKQMEVNNLILSHRIELDGMPKDFKILGSNNGIDFNEIVKITNQTGWIANIERQFFFNSVNYRYYRIELLTNNGMNWFSIGKVSFNYKIDGKPYSWQKVSSTTPTKDQFLSDGMDSLSPLLDRRVETLEPIEMIGRNDILQTGDVGKVFSKKIDLKKYMDIRAIRVELR